MNVIKLTIDGRELTGQAGDSILQIARMGGVEIPTLCHDERVKTYGSCGVCLVEVDGTPKLFRSCSTLAADGMVVHTETERVRTARKTALELLLSDHTGDCRPPCLLACPGGTDCQGYVGLIANGETEEALRLIYDKIPLPGAIGRVCPHPCEEACRRERVEEPIAIAGLKRFAADTVAASGGIPLPEPEPDTGKRVAVVGGGPGGLSAAWFLRLRGHKVDIFDAMPRMGGMLRYGIPEYRLPKAELDREIEIIRSAGIGFYNNTRLGNDITLESLKSDYQAVVLAVGAWSSSGLRCPGEELPGVIGGIDFLRQVACGEMPGIGKRVAIVGGGNTAMDACRTAVRLGAEEVYNIYRRTRNEMPAEEVEIAEAEEEGVIFRYLTNPIEITGDSKVQSIRLQMMELGEPDASGRRAPVPVEGAEEILQVDTVIAAIGQKLNPEGLDGVELTKWRTIQADETTFRTSLEGVFAIGDATNNGADIAISAIGEAKRAAEIIDRYLAGENTGYQAPFLVKSEPDDEFFASYETKSRQKMHHRSPEARRGDFREIIPEGYTPEQAVVEASRCLECGCHDYFECRLIQYANDYHVEPERFGGTVHHRVMEDSHPLIHRNPDKCILCGLCTRICEEVVGATALGLVGRGFDATVQPALDLPLNQTECVACGQCVHACPTGALTETVMIPKQVPVAEMSTGTTCSLCSVGCHTRLTHTGGRLLRSLPLAQRPEDALLCVKGRFGAGETVRDARLTQPLLRDDDGALRPASYSEAMVHTAKRLQSIATMEGPGAIGVAVSPRYTNEQAAGIRNYATEVLGTRNLFSFGEKSSGLADVLGTDRSTAGWDDLASADLILLVDAQSVREHHLVADLRVRRAVENGARLLVLEGTDSPTAALAELALDVGESLSVLRQVVKAALTEVPAAQELPGCHQLAASLEGCEPDEDTVVMAQALVESCNAVIVFPQDFLSRDAARLLGDLALLAGTAGDSRCRIIQLKPGANSQGLADLGFLGADRVDVAALRGLLVFGEEVPPEASALSFLAVQDLYLTGTAARADVVFPGESFAETDGTFTSATGESGQVRAALPALCGHTTEQLIHGLVEAAGQHMAAVSPASGGENPPSPACLVPPEGDSFHCRPVTADSVTLQFRDFAAAHNL